jgi:hypothetical protein
VNQTVTLKYTKDAFTFPALHVWHHYRAAGHQSVDSPSEDRKTTGFRLRWFLRSSAGRRLTEERPARPEDWRPVAATPRYREAFLRAMVGAARGAREGGVTVQEIMEKALRVKTSTMKGHYRGCSEGHQVLFDWRQYRNIARGLSVGTSEQPVNDEDIRVGFKIFSVLFSCPKNLERTALHQFFHDLLFKEESSWSIGNLIVSESPRTIIQATVNTIQSGNITKEVNRNLTNQFYLALDKIFHFQLGKILLATSTHEELDSMVAKDWPFFAPYSQELEQCLRNTSCRGVRDVVNTLG